VTAPGAEELRERARAVELLVLDVDGVLTDGGLFYGPDGELFKRFDVKDGHAVMIARRMGLRVAILTARRSRIVQVRGEELGIDPISQGTKDKRAGFEALLAQVGIAAEKTAYVGDDVNDLGPLSLARLACSPADGALEARQAAHYVTRAPGGHGAVREVVALVLQAQQKWEQVIESMRAGHR
jgi:3-deoxy-D-manno-octulosonate 8-phosphate phosphatase (KDO 8-P phosphatase)